MIGSQSTKKKEIVGHGTKWIYVIYLNLMDLLDFIQFCGFFRSLFWTQFWTKDCLDHLGNKKGLTRPKNQKTHEISVVRKFVSIFSFALQLKAKDLPKLSPIRPFVVRNPQKFCALSTLFSLLKMIFGADRASLFFGLQKLGRYSSCPTR